MTRHHQNRPMKKAFTLIELLVVLAIIGLLAAILFPVLSKARESGYQASCASNLHQIYLAVELYRNDEGGYPASLAVLLGDTDNLADHAASSTVVNTGGKGYFKGGMSALVCADDDTTSTLPRSSYGDISVDVSAGPTTDMGRFVWNYWGYRAAADTAPCDADDTHGCMGTEYQPDDLDAYPASNPTALLAPGYVSVFSDGSRNRFWLDPNSGYDESTNPIDVTKLPRLANRFAPKSTIITHCVYHRLPTSNTSDAFDIYNTDGSGQGAKDIILLLDGSTKVLDVTTDAFVNQEAWAVQRF